MKIVIPGGSGQVGTLLARTFHAEGHEVVVLSRKPRPAPWRTAAWDGETVGSWAAEVDGAGAVVNLAGHTVNCRYHAANRRRILESRVRSTRAVGQAIAGARRPPPVWLQASTATLYAHRYDAPNDERGMQGGGEPGAPRAWDFSIEVARAWEAALEAADTPHTRRVALRAAMVMSPDRGGVFDALLGLARLGLGGRHGDGRQYVSWVHEHDFVRAVRWLLEHGEMEGAVNVAAPVPLPNAEFMRVLREAAGIRFGLPQPAWMLALGALLLRTETELVLKSRRVVPGRLREAGFVFEHPEWPGAARELVGRWNGWRLAARAAAVEEARG